jgi:hypothetical protein
MRAMPGAIMPGPLWGKNKRSKGSITLLRQSLRLFLVLITIIPTTSNMTAQDPAGSTATERLKPGAPPTLKSAPSKVVEADSYAPSNASRLGIRGKDGVAEMAVIDDGEPSVTINANNNIYTIAKAEHHSYSSLFLQMVNGDRYVDVIGNDYHGTGADQKISIGGNQEITVIGQRKDKVVGEHWFHNDGVSNEVRVGAKHGAYLAEESKLTVGIYNEVTKVPIGLISTL